MDQQISISHAMEDYMKAIYELSSVARTVSTSQLAQRMDCTPASVTNMLQKLSSLKLVKYTPYRGVKLTSAGQKVALQVLRHHRLIELYLAEVLGYSWDKVHAEADQLEHVISEELENRIDEALGHPERDPHGAPIPSKNGEVAGASSSTLWETAVGDTVMIERVDDKDPEVLRYLASLGVYPAVRLSVLKKAPFNGPIHVLIGKQEHGLSEQLARQIFVSVT